MVATMRTSPRKCFIYLSIVTAVLVFLTYTLYSPFGPTPTMELSRGKSIIPGEGRASPGELNVASLVNQPNVTSSLFGRTNVSFAVEQYPAEFNIRKKSLRFYQAKISKVPFRMRQKILAEVPDEAHRMAMAAIVSSLGRDKFMALATNLQERMYVTFLKKVGYQKRLPTVINIGAKKAGTTALGLYLRSHPQVASSLGNEVHYFDWNYDRGISYYRSKMAYSREGQEVFEKTPRYFITADVPRRIRDDVSPDVKLIISVRDPVQRAVSDFHHEQELYSRVNNKARETGRPPRRTRGPEIASTFEATVLRENGEINTESELVQIGMYVEHLKRWLKYFPLSQILVIDGDQMTKTPLQIMKTVENFLGLDPYFTEDHFQYSELHHVYCLALPEPKCKFSSPHKIPKPVLSDELRKKMYDFYRPYSQELMKLLNQTFPWAEL